MKLPNGESSIVEIEKLRDYCLSAKHPRGRHKARVIYSALAMTFADAQELRAALIDAAAREDAEPGTSDLYGDRYAIDFELTRGERSARIRSIWIIRTGEIAP